MLHANNAPAHQKDPEIRIVVWEHASHSHIVYCIPHIFPVPFSITSKRERVLAACNFTAQSQTQRKASEIRPAFLFPVAPSRFGRVIQNTRIKMWGSIDQWPMMLNRESKVLFACWRSEALEKPSFKSFLAHYTARPRRSRRRAVLASCAQTSGQTFLSLKFCGLYWWIGSEELIRQLSKAHCPHDRAYITLHYPLRSGFWSFIFIGLTSVAPRGLRLESLLWRASTNPVYLSDRLLKYLYHDWSYIHRMQKNEWKIFISKAKTIKNEKRNVWRSVQIIWFSKKIFKTSTWSFKFIFECNFH